MALRGQVNEAWWPLAPTAQVWWVDAVLAGMKKAVMCKNHFTCMLLFTFPRLFTHQDYDEHLSLSGERRLPGQSTLEQRLHSLKL